MRDFTYAEATEIRYNRQLFEELSDTEKEEVRTVWDMMDTMEDEMKEQVYEECGY